MNFSKLLRRNLVHEQVRFPSFIHVADEMLDERNVIGAAWLSQQGHARLFRRSVSLGIVAPDARAHQILPSIFPGS